METKIDSKLVRGRIVRDPAGVCRVFCKRAKHKWWFELGQHRETDAAFEAALATGNVLWSAKIIDRSKLF